MSKTPLAVFCAALAAAVGHYIYFYPRLPEQVASHFDMAGEPNGYSSRQGFATIYLATLFLVSGSLLAVPVLIRILPTSMINVPHRDYWLAPERAGETVRRLGDSCLWLGVLTIGFCVATVQLVIQANLAPDSKLGDEFGPVLIGFFVAIIAWVIAIIRQFRLPPDYCSAASRSARACFKK